MPNSKTIKTIEIEEAIITLKDNDIVYVYFKSGVVIDCDTQEKLLLNYGEITKGKLHPFLFYADEQVSITKEARDNAIVIEDRAYAIASAILVNNLAHRLIANFYLKFNKPQKPYKVFNRKKDAVNWLLNFVEK
jgi:hypothetical protein